MNNTHVTFEVYSAILRAYRAHEAFPEPSSHEIDDWRLEWRDWKPKRRALELSNLKSRATVAGVAWREAVAAATAAVEDRPSSRLVLTITVDVEGLSLTELIQIQQILKRELRAFPARALADRTLRDVNGHNSSLPFKMDVNVTASPVTESAARATTSVVTLAHVRGNAN